MTILQLVGESGAYLLMGLGGLAIFYALYLHNEFRYFSETGEDKPTSFFSTPFVITPLIMAVGGMFISVGYAILRAEKGLPVRPALISLAGSVAFFAYWGEHLYKHRS